MYIVYRCIHTQYIYLADKQFKKFRGQVYIFSPGKATKHGIRQPTFAHDCDVLSQPSRMMPNRVHK